VKDQETLLWASAIVQAIFELEPGDWEGDAFLSRWFNTLMRRRATKGR
jgi:hypothetical protein